MDIHPSGAGCAGGNGHDRGIARGFQGVEDGFRGIVIDTDDGRLSGSLTVEDALLGRDIAVHPAMTVQMVRRDVEQNCDVKDGCRQQFELVGRQLKNIGARRVQGWETKSRRPDIAAHNVGDTDFRQDVRDQGRSR